MPDWSTTKQLNVHFDAPVLSLLRRLRGAGLLVMSRYVNRAVAEALVRDGYATQEDMAPVLWPFPVDGDAG
jgi:hypothetical protein